MVQGYKGSGTSGGSKVNGTKHTGVDGGDSHIYVTRTNNSGIAEEKDLVFAQGGLGGHGGEHGGSDADKKARPQGYANIYWVESIIPSGKFESLCFGRKGSGTHCKYAAGTTATNSESGDDQGGCPQEWQLCRNRMLGGQLDENSGELERRCNIGHLTKDNQKQFNKFFEGYNITKLYPETDCTSLTTSGRFCSMPGMGGGADQSWACSNTGTGDENAHWGTDGRVKIATIYNKAGNGGSAGNTISDKFFPTLGSKYLTITIGAGGTAGITSRNASGWYASTAGGNGGDTIVKNDKGELLIGLTGGRGGSGIFLTNALSDVAGGNGDTTSLFYSNKPARGLGGFSYADPAHQSGMYNSSKDAIQSKGYGDGGGGGAFSNVEGAGNGAAGANGVVMIQW